MFDAVFSTQGVMVMLLAAYAGAMWMFLTSAPKVHTVMVSDIDQAKAFYEGQLELAKADVPLHYYYGYEQSLGVVTDPIYLPTEARSMASATRTKVSGSNAHEGLWYQLQKNTQLHIVPGSRATAPNRDGTNPERNRHVCFNRNCIEQVLLRAQILGIKHKVRSDKPLEFLVKDADGRIIEIAEVAA